MEATILLLLIALLGASSISAYSIHAVCRTSNETLTVDRLADSEVDPLMPYYDIGTKFIQAVHLNKPLDASHVKKAEDYFAKNGEMTLNEVLAELKPLLLDQAIFLTLAILGLLFVVLFPLVGLIFCCCRMSGKCGGKKYQEGSSAISCVLMSTILIVSFVAFSAGAILYGLNNQKLFKELKTVPVDFARQTHDVLDFVEFVSGDLDCSLRATYDFGRDGMVGVADNSTDMVYGMIMNVTGMRDLRELQVESEVLSVMIDELNTNVSQLCKEGQSLNSSVLEFLNNFENSLIGNEYLKSSPEAPRAEIIGELTAACLVRAIDVPKVKVNFIAMTDPYVWALGNETSQIQQAINSTAASLPPTQLDDALYQLHKMTAQALDTLNRTKSAVDGGVGELARTLSMEWYEYLGLVLIAPIVIIALCLLFGLLCGLCTYSSKKAPFDRSCASDCGGSLLMSAAGLMFLFGWILMALTILAFAGGYIGETVVCQPFFEKPDSQVLRLLPNITLDQSTGTVLSVEEILDGCRANESLYDVLHLDSMINLDSTLAQINRSFTQATEKLNLSTYLDASQFTYSLTDEQKTALDEMSKGLETLIDVLSRERALLLEPNKTMAQLRSIREFLRGQPSSNDVSTFLNTTTILLDRTVVYGRLVTFVQNLATGASELAARMQVTIGRVPRQAPTQAIADGITLANALIEGRLQIGIRDVLRVINTTVRNTGPCRPLYDVYENVGELLCHRVMYPLQGFWMSMGLCAVFFLPAVICAIKLAKYFRRMDEHYYFEHNTAAQPPQQVRWATSVEMPVRRAW